MSLTNRLKVKARVKECFDIATGSFGQTFPLPHVEFNLKGTTAGMAYPGQWRLNFNEVLLDENLEEFIKQTVAHECAHLIDHQVYGSLSFTLDPVTGRRKRRQPHGPNWARCMAVLGVPAERCHDMDTSNAKTRKTQGFEYRCEGCKKVFTIGKVRHNRFQSGQKTYRHCKGHTLTFVG